MVASIQGHFDPWHPRLLARTEAQLDAILEAYSEDFPDKLKFERKKDKHGIERIEILSAQWSGRLIGSALDAHKSKVTFKIPNRIGRKARSAQVSEGPQRQVYTPARAMPSRR